MIAAGYILMGFGIFLTVAGIVLQLFSGSERETEFALRERELDLRERDLVLRERQAHPS